MRAVNEINECMNTPVRTATNNNESNIPLPSNLDGNARSLKIGDIVNFIKDHQTTGQESNDQVVNALKQEMERIVRYATDAIIHHMRQETGTDEIPSWGKLDQKRRRELRGLAAEGIVTAGIPVNRATADWVMQYVISNHWHSKIGHRNRTQSQQQHQRQSQTITNEDDSTQEAGEITPLRERDENVEPTPRHTRSNSLPQKRRDVNNQNDRRTKQVYYEDELLTYVTGLLSCHL